LLIALAASPQARAADSARPPDTVKLIWQPEVPTNDGGSPASTRHESHETQTPAPDDDTIRILKETAIGTIVTIAVAAGVCVITSGALCMFPLGF
jgi:hypothetical protein